MLVGGLSFHEQALIGGLGRRPYVNTVQVQTVTGHFLKTELQGEVYLKVPCVPLLRVVLS